LNAGVTRGIWRALQCAISTYRHCTQHYDPYVSRINPCYTGPGSLQKLIPCLPCPNGYLPSNVHRNQSTTFLARRDSIARTSYGNVAGWLGGWMGGWVSVCHSRHCMKTTTPILKLFDHLVAHDLSI